MSSGYPGGGVVLESVDLEVGAAETVAVMGRNGMGKSTLLRTIMGHLRAKAGTIAFEGRDITRLPAFAVSNLGIAYVPQGRDIFKEFSVEENLLLGVIGKRDVARRVPDSLYARFPILAERRRQHAGTLSGGEQQQLAIARALVGAPKLLLLDEPSEGIQPSIVQAIGATLAAIARERSLAMVLVEQNLELALTLAGRCVFMENGKLVHSVASQALRREPSLIERYLSV